MIYHRVAGLARSTRCRVKARSIETLVSAEYEAEKNAGDISHAPPIQVNIVSNHSAQTIRNRDI